MTHHYKFRITKMEKEFFNACYFGDLDKSKEIFAKGVDHTYNNNKAFRGVCENGHFEVAKWLVSLGGVDIHAYEDEAFYRSCYVGKFEIAEWLYSLGCRVDDDDIYQIACNEGLFDFAKQMYSSTNIYDDYKHGRASSRFWFEDCCRQGRTECSKWIYSLGVINYEELDSVYQNNKREIDQDHMEIKRWFYEMGIVEFEYKDLKIACRQNSIKNVMWLFYEMGIGVEEYKDDKFSWIYNDKLTYFNKYTYAMKETYTWIFFLDASYNERLIDKYLPKVFEVNVFENSKVSLIDNYKSLVIS